MVRERDKGRERDERTAREERGGGKVEKERERRERERLERSEREGSKSERERDKERKDKERGRDERDRRDDRRPRRSRSRDAKEPEGREKPKDLVETVSMVFHCWVLASSSLEPLAAPPSRSCRSSVVPVTSPRRAGSGVFGSRRSVLWK